jgi:hypothetical protein
MKRLKKTRVARLVDLLGGQEVLLLLRAGAASMYGERLSATESSPWKKSV